MQGPNVEAGVFSMEERLNINIFKSVITLFLPSSGTS